MQHLSRTQIITQAAPKQFPSRTKSAPQPRASSTHSSQATPKQHPTQHPSSTQSALRQHQSS
eukprot:3502812-Lingulodinium_polyedra.AAC.1